MIDSLTPKGVFSTALEAKGNLPPKQSVAPLLFTQISLKSGTTISTEPVGPLLPTYKL